MATTTTERPRAWAGNHAPKPLPFSPKSLDGLSERLLLSHHANNYAGAVKRLNLIENQLAALSSESPPFLRGALKREELIAFNSMVLHELYFANLGAGMRKDNIEREIAGAYGSYENWQQEFLGTGMALAGGSGWVVLCYHPATKTLRTGWASDHSQSMVMGVPLLVMDMYEHSFAMDYGADAQKYVAAFIKNVNWEEVERRFESASKER